MKRLLILLLFAVPLSAQTVVNFDVPVCSGNGVKIYQGIDFSISPWDCERPNLQGDPTETISWYVNNRSGKFRFLAPSVLTSLRASSSFGAGTITISTDAGEILTIAAQPGIMPPVQQTGFTKAASIVTVSFPGGWTIELDDLTYRPPTPPPPPPPPTITGITISCSSLAVVFGATSNCSAVITGTGAFDNGAMWTVSSGIISAGGIFTAPFVEGSVVVTATSIQDATKSASTTIIVSRSPINMDVTLRWSDGTFIAGTVQVQQQIAGVYTTLVALTLDANGNIKGPVMLDLSQSDPLVVRLALSDSAGKDLGFIQETVPKAMFNGITKATASMTIVKETMTISDIASWKIQ